jgi:chromosome segregation ATPase
MKKLFIILVALIGFGFSAFAQQLSSEQQAIINRQQAEVQQLRNSAAEWQKKADDAWKRYDALKYTLSKMAANEDGRAGFAVRVERAREEAEGYQKKAKELNAKANEQERLLNEAIRKAKENARKASE